MTFDCDHVFHHCVFQPADEVVLRQTYFTASAVFEPGVYYAGQLPKAVFELGLVDQLPPVKGKSAELRPNERPAPEAPDAGRHG